MRKLMVVILTGFTGTFLFAQDQMSTTKELLFINQKQSGFDIVAKPIRLSPYYQDSDKTYKGHNYGYYSALYKKAKSTEKTGKILLIAGGSACVVGFVAGTIGFAVAWGGDDNGEPLFWTGFALASAGLLALNIGIPMKITGSAKRKNNFEAMKKGWPKRKSELKNLTLGITSHGVGLTLRL